MTLFTIIIITLLFIYLLSGKTYTEEPPPKIKMKIPLKDRPQQFSSPSSESSIKRISQIYDPNSPKAIVEVCGENKFYDSFIVAPIDKLKQFKELPLWIDLNKKDNKPRVYKYLFWEIEPMGEYLYYLAGDYEKTFKGLLRFGTESISFRVEINFENDVISVAQHDGLIHQRIAIYNGIDLNKILHLSTGEVMDNFSLPENHSWSDQSVGFTSLQSYLPSNAKGVARIVFYKFGNYSPPSTTQILN